MGARPTEIRLLGPFAVLQHGEPIAEQQIGSRKARTLLKRLLVERERVVGTDALAGTLWPQGLPDQPDRHLATLVSRLRAALGSEVIVRLGEGYQYRGTGYVVDADEAERFTAQAERRLGAGEPGLARTAAGRALELLDRASCWPTSRTRTGSSRRVPLPPPCCAALPALAQQARELLGRIS